MKPRYQARPRRAHCLEDRPTSPPATKDVETARRRPKKGNIVTVNAREKARESPFEKLQGWARRLDRPPLGPNEGSGQGSLVFRQRQVSPELTTHDSHGCIRRAASPASGQAPGTSSARSEQNHCGEFFSDTKSWSTLRVRSTVYECSRKAYSLLLIAVIPQLCNHTRLPPLAKRSTAIHCDAPLIPEVLCIFHIGSSAIFVVRRRRRRPDSQ